MKTEDVLDMCHGLQREYLRERSIHVDTTACKDSVVVQLAIFQKKGSKCKIFYFYSFWDEKTINTEWHKVEKYLKRLKR